MVPFRFRQDQKHLIGTWWWEIWWQQFLSKYRQHMSVNFLDNNWENCFKVQGEKSFLRYLNSPFFCKMNDIEKHACSKKISSLRKKALDFPNYSIWALKQPCINYFLLWGVTVVCTDQSHFFHQHAESNFLLIVPTEAPLPPSWPSHFHPCPVLTQMFQSMRKQTRLTPSPGKGEEQKMC